MSPREVTLVFYQEGTELRGLQLAPRFTPATTTLGPGPSAQPVPGEGAAALLSALGPEHRSLVEFRANFQARLSRDLKGPVHLGLKVRRALSCKSSEGEVETAALRVGGAVPAGHPIRPEAADHGSGLPGARASCLSGS